MNPARIAAVMEGVMIDRMSFYHMQSQVARARHVTFASYVGRHPVFTASLASLRCTLQ